MSVAVHSRIPSVSKSKPRSILRDIAALVFIILLMVLAWLLSHFETRPD